MNLKILITYQISAATRYLSGGGGNSNLKNPAMVLNIPNLMVNYFCTLQ